MLQDSLYCNKHRAMALERMSGSDVILKSLFFCQLSSLSGLGKTKHSFMPGKCFVCYILLFKVALKYSKAILSREVPRKL